MIVIGYLRVSTEEQASSGLGLEAQRSTIQKAADARGWQVIWIEDAGHSAKTLKRPGITKALAALKKGEAQGLVVAKLDRLSRSVQDFAATLDTARKQVWSLVALDLGVDSSTPAGEMVATVMAAVAQWERRVISDRTKDALAAAKDRGTRLGRPRAIDPALLAEIVATRATGASLRAIARDLNDRAVPTVRGGRCWHPATIRGLLESAALDAEPDGSTTPDPLPTT